MSYDFQELCIPCYPELLAYAAKRTKNRSKAEDIVQEAVLRALDAWERWEPQGEPTIWARAWMFRIVHNVFALQYQRDKTFARITGTSRDPEKGPSPEVGMVAAELHQNVTSEHPYYQSDAIGDEVLEALGRIKPEWAEVVQLVYIDGVPANEVAQKLNLAQGTVRSRMARGRLALARILSPFAKQRFGYLVRPELADGADEALTAFESTQLPEQNSCRVHGVVAQDDALLFSIA